MELDSGTKRIIKQTSQIYEPGLGAIICKCMPLDGLYLYRPIFVEAQLF